MSEPPIPEPPEPEPAKPESPKPVWNVPPVPDAPAAPAAPPDAVVVDDGWCVDATFSLSPQAPGAIPAATRSGNAPRVVRTMIRRLLWSARAKFRTVLGRP